MLLFFFDCPVGIFQSKQPTMRAVRYGFESRQD